jgi:hypothetical protein
VSLRTIAIVTALLCALALYAEWAPYHPAADLAAGITRNLGQENSGR